MKVLRAVLTGLLLSLPAIAAAQDVKVDFDKAFDFSTIKTFSMKLGTGWGNDLSQRRVLTEFEEAIAAKGWKKVDEAQANMQVVLHGATQTKRTASTFYTGMGGGYGGYHYGGMGMGSSQTVVNEYTVGTARRGHVRAEVEEPGVSRCCRRRDLGQPQKKCQPAGEGIYEDVQELPAGSKEAIAP